MISIVIPALNEEKFIADCLKSLKDQDYKGEYEIIVADNGSTDITASIARDMGARVVMCPQRGVARARQAGADAAFGDIIIQADADTIYPRDWLSRIVKHFSSHPKVVAVSGSFVYQNNPPWWARIEYFLRMFFNMLTLFLFRRPFIPSGANFAFYKKAFRQIGGYSYYAYSSDQYDIATRLSRAGKILYDWRLQVKTSNRSVQKPLHSIIAAFVLHIVRFLANTFRTTTYKLPQLVLNLKPPTLRTYIKIALPVLLLSILGYGYFVPASPVFGKVYTRAPATADKLVALTFDDGPNEPYTSEVLNILDYYDIKATFFVIGANVKMYPDVSRRIVAEGNVIGNHTFVHSANHALTLSSRKEIRETQQAIYEVTGVIPRIYRPPHGKKTPWELQAVRSEGLVEVLWSISTNELGKKTPQQLAAQIIKKTRPGGIILLHDGYGTLHDSGRAEKELTLEMLPRVIESLQARGYKFVTVPELLNIAAYSGG